jgi:glycosyltransferase involved in cell wall biosynthesis
MRIAIDISQVVYGTGVSVYTQNLVKALLTIDKANKYVLFGGSLRRCKELKEWLRDLSRARQNVKGRIFPIPPTLLDILWNRLHIFPIENFVGPVDVFHASDWSQPPVKKPKIVTTIHDLGFLKFPESVHPKVLAAQKRRLSWVKKEADMIIAVSEATKKEAINLLGISEKKIVVIYEGVPEDAIGFKPEMLDSLKKAHNISKPYIFAYGSAAPRKNVARIIGAFNIVKKDINLQLVISGEYQPQRNLPEGVIVTGFLPREQMLTLLSGAEALVFPSLYEGFGLIILEAFALGVPVVTSSISSMPEVAGRAAVLVNPLERNNIARGIIESIRDRNKLGKMGAERLKNFSWKQTAEKTLKVYKKASKL